MSGSYQIVKKRYGYVVIDTKRNTHAHLPNYKGCKILLHLMKRDVEIKDKYLRKARDRLDGRYKSEIRATIKKQE